MLDSLPSLGTALSFPGAPVRTPCYLEVNFSLFPQPSLLLLGQFPLLLLKWGGSRPAEKGEEACWALGWESTAENFGVINWVQIGVVSPCKWYRDSPRSGLLRGVFHLPVITEIIKLVQQPGLPHSYSGLGRIRCHPQHCPEEMPGWAETKVGSSWPCSLQEEAVGPVPGATHSQGCFCTGCYGSQPVITLQWRYSTGRRRKGCSAGFCLRWHQSASVEAGAPTLKQLQLCFSSNTGG